MKKSERADFISKKLEELFPKTSVPLNHKDPYTLLIAVLLSAQCTDKRVNKVTPHLFAKADTPEKMVKLSVKEIDNFVRSCGLTPRKAQAIFDLSNILIKKFQSKVPQNFQDLESLPGVGHKTASVVMSQAFGHPAFPVDTHIHRLAQQWGLTNGKNVVQTEKDLKRLFPEKLWNELHIRIIYFGREYCSTRECNGMRCQICQHCFPSRKKNRDWKRA